LQTKHNTTKNRTQGKGSGGGKTNPNQTGEGGVAKKKKGILEKSGGICAQRESRGEEGTNQLEDIGEASKGVKRGPIGKPQER